MSSGTGKRITKVDYITLEKMEPLFHTHSCKAAARKLNVSENTLRKASKRYGHYPWPYVPERLRARNSQRLPTGDFNPAPGGGAGGGGGGEPALNFAHVDVGVFNPSTVGGGAVSVVSNLINANDGEYSNPATQAGGGGNVNQGVFYPATTMEGGGGGPTMSNLINDITDIEHCVGPFTNEPIMDGTVDGNSEFIGDYGYLGMNLDDLWKI